MRRPATGTVVAIVVTIVAGCGGREQGAGPFAWPNGDRTLTGALVKPRQIAVIGIPFAHTATKPAILLGVHPLATDDATGLRLRYAGSTGYGGHIGRAYGWRPKKWQLQPVPGFEIPANTGAGVTIGASATKDGVYLLHGFVVDYRIGDTHYSAPQEAGLELCVGSVYWHRCR